MDIEMIYERYANDLFRYLYSLTRNRERAEDMLQETFTKTYTTLLAGSIREVKPWLFKVAYYTYIDDLRKERRIVTEKVILNAPSAEEVVVAQSSYEELLQHLDYVRPLEKQAILLCDIYDCTNEEAANILEVNINTLKSYLYRGRQKMKRRLEGVQHEKNI